MHRQEVLMRMDGWRLIEDGLCDASSNMAADRAMLQACSEGLIPPTLRLYGWSNPALTLGYSQNADGDVDQTRCRELGIPLLRRPTGGRAILHQNELTYCVVAPVPHLLFPQDLKGAYRVIAGALLLGLEEMGIRGGALALPRKGLPRQDRSPACFSSLNHCEIAVRGRKLIGSAQRRLSNAFLQHGSVIIKSNHDLSISLLRFGNAEHGRENLQKLSDSTIDLNEMIPGVGFEEVRGCFRSGFDKFLSGNMEKGELTSIESALCDRFLGSVLL